MDATIERDDTGFTLKVERVFAHAPEKVWRVVTERGFLQQWFPADIEGEWAVGASLTFTFLVDVPEELAAEYRHGEVVTVDEPRLLEFLWGDQLLRFELAPEGEGCRFRLSEELQDLGSGARSAAGWEMCLDNLDLALNGLAVAKFVAKVWSTKFRHYAQVFEEKLGTRQEMPEGFPELHEEVERQND